MKKLVEARLPLDAGGYQVAAFGTEGDLHPHLALISDTKSKERAPLVRIHSECMTGDVFGSTRCDCGAQLDQALVRIGKEGGCLIYLRQEGRGIGLVEKLKAYNLQDDGLDTIQANEALGHPADARTFEAAAAILKALNLAEVRLLTNNPEKVNELEANDITVVKREPLVIAPLAENAAYLEVKKTLMGHWLD